MKNSIWVNTEDAISLLVNPEFSKLDKAITALDNLSLETNLEAVRTMADNMRSLLASIRNELPGKIIDPAWQDTISSLRLDEPV